MSEEEFSRYYLNSDLGLFKPPCDTERHNCWRKNYAEQDLRINPKRLPAINESFDWRDKGFVTPVLSQQMCNSCWAFSVIGVMETMAAIRGYGLTRLSIQELIDCMEKGCMGRGSTLKALNYLCSLNRTVVTEKEYPLNLSYNNTYCPIKHVGINIESYKYRCDMDENDMVRDIFTHGPLVAVVNGRNWQNYIGGIIRYSCPGDDPNHAIQIVGYHGYGATDGSIPYYIVKNSYGEDVGEKGYVKVAMMQNVCGINERVAKLSVVRATS